MAARNPPNNENIVDIVRRVVTTINGLDGANQGTTSTTVDGEVNNSFRLPRNQVVDLSHTGEIEEIQEERPALTMKHRPLITS